MAGAEKLIEKILNEARQQAQANLDKAEEQAAMVSKNAKEKAMQKEKAAIEKARIDAEERKRRLIASAELDARKERLKAKQEVIEEAFIKAVEKLNTLPKEKYFSILADMIVNSARNGNSEIILSLHDKERIEASFIDGIKKHLLEKGFVGSINISDEVRDIKGGFILKMGDIEMNNSFDAILRMKRDELEPEVVKILFGV